MKFEFDVPLFRNLRYILWFGDASFSIWRCHQLCRRWLGTFLLWANLAALLEISHHWIRQLSDCEYTTLNFLICRSCMSCRDNCREKIRSLHKVPFIGGNWWVLNLADWSYTTNYIGHKISIKIWQIKPCQFFRLLCIFYTHSQAELQNQGTHKRYWCVGCSIVVGMAAWRLCCCQQSSDQDEGERWLTRQVDCWC